MVESVGSSAGLTFLEGFLVIVPNSKTSRLFLIDY